MYMQIYKCRILDANYSERLLLSLMVDHIIIEILKWIGIGIISSPHDTEMMVIIV